MCKITKKSRKKSFTGYKSVLVINDKYYSPVTGMEIKIGPIPIITHRQNHANRDYVNVFDESIGAHEPKMKGMTGVFIEQERAQHHFPADTILKICISGNLHHGHIQTCGNHNVGNVIIGNHIDKITQL